MLPDYRLLEAVRFGQVQEVVEAPRVFSWGLEAEVERGFPEGVRQELAARGHEPIVLTGRPSYPESRRAHAPGRERANGVEIHRVPTLARREGALGRGLHYLGFAVAALARANAAARTGPGLNRGAVRDCWPRTARRRVHGRAPGARQKGPSVN